jgi:hypothetical protein
MSTARFIGSLALPLGLVCACSTQTDGAPFDVAALNHTTCATDLDCGPGRYCGPEGSCAIDCVTSKDCVNFLPDPGLANDLTCSLCGRCLPASAARDSKCLSATDQPCTTSNDCLTAIGTGYSCNTSGYCAKQCQSDTDCTDVGRGWGCGKAGLCVRSCFKDENCYFFGWKYSCNLPMGVDPAMNADSQNPVYGECVLGASVPGFQAATPTSPQSAQYQGIWGWIATAAAQVNGVPVITRLNSVSIHHLLVKITWSGNDLTIQPKWCNDVLQNFNDNDSPPFNLFNVLLPDRNIDSVLVYSFQAHGVPALNTGSAFVTDPMLDIRGAKLKTPATDPLPTYHDIMNMTPLAAVEWDQDRDGKPGMTAHVTGVYTGDLYQTQRWSATFHASVLDQDHMLGLISGYSDAAILGATDPNLLNDAVTTAHPDPTRSYFRAMRLADDASCLDVIRIANTMGSWLEFQPHFDPNQKP